MQTAHRIAATVKKRARYEDYIVENLKDAKPFQGGAINHVWRGIWYLGEAQFLYSDQVLYDQLTGNKHTWADRRATASNNRVAGACDEQYGLPLTTFNSRNEYSRFLSEGDKNPRSFQSLPTFNAIRDDECQAFYEFNVALDLAPNDANAREFLGEYYLSVADRDDDSGFEPESQREYREACPQFQAAASIEPSGGEHWLMLAELYGDEKNKTWQGNVHSIFEDANHFDRDYFIQFLRKFANQDMNKDYALHIKRADLTLANSSSRPSLQELLTDRPGQLPAC